MKHLLTIFLLFLLNVTAFAQKAATFSGRVTDAHGNPVASASVILINEKGNNIKFAKTDKQGHFSIVQPEGKVTAKLAFLCLGYARQEIAVGTFQKGDKHVTLTEKVQQIREVEVTPEVFRIKGDTIAYSVAGLREKQDRTIEDVISRIPGIKVDVTGQISYRDAPINKFYVDGKDMAGESYAMVSKNLSADKVDSVEVLQHHQPINALRGKEFSSAAALNLVLKDGVKLHWTGTGEVGTGLALQKPWGWNRKLRFVEMYFGNHLQTISLYKHNNIGEDVSQEVRSLTFDQSEQGILHNIGSIGRGRYGFNNSHLAATNWFIKTGKDANIRLQMSGLFDKSTSNGYSERTYLDVGNTTFMTEQRTANSYTSRWKAEMNYTYNGMKMYVDNRASGSLDFSHSNASTRLNDAEKYELVKPHKRNVSDELNINLAKGKDYRQALSSYFNYTFLPGHVRLYNGSDEQLDMKALSWKTEYEQTATLFKLLQFHLAVRYDMESKSEFVAYNDTMQSLHYKKDLIEIVPNLSFHLATSEQGNMDFSLNMPFGWISRSILNDKDRRWYAEPNVFFKWEIDNCWSLNSNYNHTFSPSGFYEANPIRVYTSYNYATSGTGQNNYSSGDYTSASLSYQSPGYGWSTRFDYSYSANTYRTLYESVLNQGVYVRNNVSDENRSVTQSLGWRIGRNLRAMRTNISLDCDYKWNTYYILLNQVKTPTHMKGFNAYLNIRMRPWKIFNFEERSSFFLSKQNAGTSHNLYRSFQHTLDLYFQPGMWQLAMKNECRHSADGSEKFSLYSSVSLSYKTQKYELGINCNNLWGTNKQEYRAVSATGSTYSITYFRPREILTSLIFNL